MGIFRFKEAVSGQRKDKKPIPPAPFRGGKIRRALEAESFSSPFAKGGFKKVLAESGKLTAEGFKRR
jgi:hypothetical protein